MKDMFVLSLAALLAPDQRLWLAAAILLATLAIVVVRPRGLNVAWAASVGAVVMVALGLLSPRSLTTIFGDTWDAAATLIALLILSEALDANGFFVWAARRLARLAGGSGWRLYALTLLLTTGVAALLANDGAVLMLTPIFAKLLAQIYPEARLQLPFLFAAGFFADAMSGLFIPSNLTNIIIADAAHLGVLQSVAWTLLPTLAAFVVAGGAFALRFRARLNTRFDVAAVGDPDAAIRDRFVFWAGWVALGALVVGYAIVGALGLPVALVAGVVALGMLALVRARRLRTVREAVTAAPWSVLIYAIGMFVVITAAYRAGALAIVVDLLRAGVATSSGAPGAIGAGALAAALAAAVNNLPAALIGVLSLRAVGGIGAASHVAIYAIMLGVDIGPKLTPFGSLATLLWLGILERHGQHISWGLYLRENWWVTLLTLTAALAALLIPYAIFG